MSLSNIKLLKPLLYEVNSWSCQIHLSSRESSAVSTDPLTGQLISVIGRARAKHRSRNKKYTPLPTFKARETCAIWTPHTAFSWQHRHKPLTVLLFTLSNPQHNTLGSEGASSNRAGAETMICTPYTTPDWRRDDLQISVHAQLSSQRDAEPT